MRRFGFGTKGHSSRQRVRTTTQLSVERLESRELLAANLTAYRPVTDYINFENYPVTETAEIDHATGPGIRINGDIEPAASENDLVQVKVEGSGGTLTWTTSTLAVWTTAAKQIAISHAAAVAAGQTLWVEYVGTSHTADADDATVTLSDGITSDQVVFHSFQSEVLAIGGNSQDPWNYVNPDILNNSQLGVYKIAGMLYTQGYDVHLFSHSQISSSSSSLGKGAAYDEAVRAITSRKVTDLAIFGYSWGGGATYELAKGLSTSSVAGKYVLKYTAYIDGITHGTISSERRLPPGTQYHDNYFQRKDWLLKGNTITSVIPVGVTVRNVNVTTNTIWGQSLVHTTLDDNAILQGLIVDSLKPKVKR